MKRLGAQGLVARFDHVGIGQWFRYLKGATEVAGGPLLISRSWPMGALILTCVSVGAIVTHLGVTGGSPAPATELLAFSILLLLELGLRRQPNLANWFR